MRSIQALTTLFFLLTSPMLVAKDIMLVLDASGSMWGQIDGTAKISIARDVVDDMLMDWRRDNNLGLIAYGHRRQGDCEDIEAILPVAPLDQNQFSSAVRALQPKGKTPLSASIRIAAQQLNYTERAATVILVSDGEETCGLDPCEVATELFNSGLDFTAHVVGFDVTEQTGLAQLQCIATNTGGSFHPAADAIELKAALASTIESVSAPPEPDRPVTLSVTTRLTADATEPEGVEWIKVYAAGPENQKGEAIEEKLGSSGEARFKLPPGNYLVEATEDAVTVMQTITIKPGAASNLDLVLNAAYLTLNALAVPGGNPIAVEWLKVYTPVNPPKQILYALGSSGTATFMVPAGQYIAEASKGVVAANEMIEVAAGETRTTQIVLNSGKLNVRAVMNQGGNPVAVEWFYVYQRQPAGGEKQITYALGGSGTAQFTLGVGDYIIEAISRGKTVRARDNVEIIADDTTEVNLNMNAGIVEIRADKNGEVFGVDWFYVNAANADGDIGPQLGYALGGSGTAQFILPAGRNYVSAKPRGAGQQQWLPVDITAGKTTAVTITIP